MGYRREDYVRIKAEFSEKYLRARTKAEERRQELYAKIPEVKQLDALLAGTAAEIMEIILKESRETAAQKTTFPVLEVISARSNVNASGSSMAPVLPVTVRVRYCDSGR